MTGEHGHGDAATERGGICPLRVAALPCLRSALVLVLLPLLAVFVGCRGNRGELVERELRKKEFELRDAKDELERITLLNEGMAREMESMRPNAANKISPEFGAQTYMVKGIVLGRGTGGYDDDDTTGDEALQVVLEPRDPDGSTVKAPGSLQVTALEIGDDGIKLPLATWDIPPDNLRRTWRSGLLSTGYYLTLPWKDRWPTLAKIRIVARFVLPDGRTFEADKDVTIRVAKPADRRVMPPKPLDAPVNPAPAPLPANEPLPPPRVVDPNAGPEVRSTSPAATVPLQSTSMWQPSQPVTKPAQLLPPIPTRSP